MNTSLWSINHAPSLAVVFYRFFTTVSEYFLSEIKKHDSASSILFHCLPPWFCFWLCELQYGQSALKSLYSDQIRQEENEIVLPCLPSPGKGHSPHHPDQRQPITVIAVCFGDKLLLQLTPCAHRRVILLPGRFSPANITGKQNYSAWITELLRICYRFLKIIIL